MKNRRWVLAVFALVLAIAGAGYAWAWATYPSDRTPEGAYLRIMSAVNRGRPEEFFAYTETPAQHACYTIGNYRRKAHQLVASTYPEPERSRWMSLYSELAQAADGADVFAIYAREQRWLDRLRRDMSGATEVEIDGERATITTSRGTRYPFRVRDNGIWGLTLFTATLLAEAERAARDYRLIQAAAEDYRRAGDSQRRSETHN